MNKKLLGAGLFLCFFLSGCAGPMIVIAEQSGSERTFTVIPNKKGDADIAIANMVEQELFRNGLRIIERPAFRYIGLKSEKSDFQSGGFAFGNTATIDAKGHNESEPAVDVVTMYADSAASHIVVTSAAGWVRIIDRTSRALIMSLDLRQIVKGNLGSDFAGIVREGLIAAGFIKDESSERQCRIVSRATPKIIIAVPVQE